MDPLQFPGRPTTEWSVLQPFSNCPYSCLFRSTWSPDRPATEWLVLQSFSDHIYAGIGCPQRKNPSRNIPKFALKTLKRGGHLFVNILHPCWDETEAFAFASLFYTELGWEQLGEQLCEQLGLQAVQWWWQVFAAVFAGVPTRHHFHTSCKLTVLPLPLPTCPHHPTRYFYKKGRGCLFRVNSVRSNRGEVTRILVTRSARTEEEFHILVVGCTSCL